MEIYEFKYNPVEFNDFFFVPPSNTLSYKLTQLGRKAQADEAKRSMMDRALKKVKK